MYVRILVATVVALATGMHSADVLAETAPESSPDNAKLARAQLEIAERAYNEKRYAEAAAAYLAADRLQPNPALQLALGKTYEQLNDPSRALASYREYFNRAPKAPDRAHVQARIAMLARQLAERGVQQISVSSEPTGASVVVDQKPIGITPIYVDLPPGQHHLEFHLQGYQSAALDFELSAQQPLNIMTTLVPQRPGAVAAAPGAAAPPSDPVAAPPAPEAAAPEAPVPGVVADTPAARPSDDGSDALLRTVGFAAIGTSVAALGGAITLELMRSHSESRARQQTEQIAFADSLDTMRSQQTLARVFAVSAGVLAAAGGVLLVLAIDGEESAAAAPELGVACVPSGCQGSLRGRF